MIDWKAVPTPWVYIVPITHVTTSEALIVEFSAEVLSTEQHLCLNVRWWLGLVHGIFAHPASFSLQSVLADTMMEDGDAMMERINAARIWYLAIG